MIGRNELRLLLSFPFAVIDLDYDLTTRAIDLLAKYSQRGIGGRDATILATAETLSLDGTMTHDEALKRMDWLKALDPILKQK